MNSAINNIITSSNELIKLNSKRQQDIWSLVVVNNSKTQEMPAVVQKLSEFDLYAVPSRSTKSKEIQNNDENILNNLTNSISGNFDCKSMIDDNVSLRYM